MTGSTGRRSTRTAQPRPGEGPAAASGAAAEAAPGGATSAALSAALSRPSGAAAGLRSPGAVGGPAVGGPAVGDLVAGVRLSALVGSGGSGQVWAGTEEPGGDRVALKLLHRQGAEREASLLSGLRHPHVLPLRRAVHDPPALVTDLADGGSLQAQVDARGSLDPAEVVTVVAPLADALAWLHGQGVVHGDVSATNVLFVGRGRPVLADLGSAHLAGSGEVSATVGFVAPEVLAGARPGPAADVHGLGAVAWLALTGTVPPAADDRLPLRLLAPECPDELAEAVTAALDPDPARRPAPEDLAGWARGACPATAVRLVPAAAVGVRPEEAVTFRVREAARRQDRRTLSRRQRMVARLRVPRRVVASALGASAAAVVLLAVLVATGPGWPSRTDPPGSSGPVGAGGVEDAVVGAAGPLASSAADPQADSPSESQTDPQADPSVGPGGTQGGASTPGAAGPPPQGQELVDRVSALVLARQQALRTGDVAGLDAVHHSGGRTLARDRELLAEGPVAVSYEVLDVRPVPDRVATATVTSLTTVPGEVDVTEQVVVVLAADEDGWQVLDVQR